MDATSSIQGRTDDELMQATAAGRAEAFEELVRRHQHRAWTIARRFLGPVDEAQDAVQQAFARLLAAAPRYEAQGAFLGYLRTTVARICLDLSARAKASPVASFSRFPSPAASLTSGVQAQADRSAVRRALDDLAPQQRLAVVLRYYDGAGYREIAEALGVTEKAAEGLLARARRNLSETLRPPPGSG